MIRFFLPAIIDFPTTLPALDEPLGSIKFIREARVTGVSSASQPTDAGAVKINTITTNTGRHLNNPLRRTAFV
jgi:hypothetical protein